MTKTSTYKITGILIALSMAAGMSASAQVPALPTVPSLPSTPSLPTVPPLPQVGVKADATVSADATVAADAPKAFMQEAYLANEFGIAASQLALQKGKSAPAKAAAQAVLNDGMKVRQDMVAAIQTSTSDMHFSQDWTDDYQQKLAELKGLSGKAFDDKYLAIQREVTQKSQTLFSGYAQSGTDASVKSFAASSLPRLQADSAKLDAAASAKAGTR